MGETISRILEIILIPYIVGALFLIAGTLAYAWIADDFRVWGQGLISDYRLT
jgi:hypothetical protein